MSAGFIVLSGDLEQILSAFVFHFYLISLTLGKTGNVFARSLAVYQYFVVVLVALHCLLRHDNRDRTGLSSCVYHDTPPRLCCFRSFLSLYICIYHTDQSDYDDADDNSDLSGRCRALAACSETEVVAESCAYD